MTAKEAPDSRKRASNPNRGAKPGERRGGRSKGTPNKATKDVREAIRELLDQAGPQMAGWLERVAEDNPGKALELALRAADFVVPKIGRVDFHPGGQGLEALVSGFTVVTGLPDPYDTAPPQTAAPAPVPTSQTAPAPASAPPAEPVRLRPPDYVPPSTTSRSDPYNPL